MSYSALDQHRQGVLEQDVFRSTIENAFNLDLTDEQFRGLLDHLPLDRYGGIRYSDFMAQFDTRWVHHYGFN